MEFVNLHVHSSTSMLDGYSSVEDYVERAVSLKQTHLAVTDHGNIHSSYLLDKTARKAGITPVWGIEAYVAPLVEGRKDTRKLTNGVWYGKFAFDEKPKADPRGDVSNYGGYTHLTMFAANSKGIENLIKMSSESWENVWRKTYPRIDQELMEKYAEGMAVFTGCPSSEIQTRLSLGQDDKAEEYLQYLISVYGKNNVYVEFMAHNFPEGNDLERRNTPKLLSLADKYGLSIVATNDSHYANPDDAKGHEHLLCMQTNSVMTDPPKSQGGSRFAFDGRGYYLRSGEETLQALIDDGIPEDRAREAVKNSVAIAARFGTAEFKQWGKLELWPEVDDMIPQEYLDGKNGKTRGDFLMDLSIRKLEEKRGRKITDEEYERLRYEIKDVIEPKGYVPYFLFTWDLMEWARRKKKRFAGPGRGSAGGAFLSYALGITLLDSMRYGLLFERFLNPERPSPPDIDLDFPESFTPEVLEYLEEKLGKERVAHLGTFSKLAPKQAIIDAGKIYDIPYQVRQSISDVIPKKETKAKWKDWEPLLRKDAKGKGHEEIIDVAATLVGAIRQAGTHACGMVISSHQITDFAPTFRTKAGETATQWPYEQIEEIGAIKEDILSITALDNIERCVSMVKLNHKKDIDLEAMIEGPMDDKKVWKLMAKGNLQGVFQMEGEGMADVISRMRPQSILETAVGVALYRPGPMGVNSHEEYIARHAGKKPATPIHPELDAPLHDLLGETEQIFCYQEQIQKAVEICAGYTPGQADNFRRAMGKKKSDVMKAEKQPFFQGMQRNGYSREAAQALWDVIEPNAEYCFNKSHAVGYAVLAYITAWLKVYYPAEYYASLLAGNLDNPGRTKNYLNDARRNGIKVHTPNVNQSAMPYGKGKDVWLGLASVSGIGAETAVAIIANGKYKDLQEFVDKNLDILPGGKNFDAIIRSGALDCFGYSRRLLLAASEEIMKSVLAVRKAKKQNEARQRPSDMLFEIEDSYTVPLPQMVPLDEYPKKTLLLGEKETLGAYISERSLLSVGAENICKSKSSLESWEPDEMEKCVRPTYYSKESWNFAGLVTSWSKMVSKKGKPYGKGILENWNGETIEFMMFDKTLEMFGEPEVDNCAVLEGSVSYKDRTTFFVDGMKILPLNEDGTISQMVYVTRKVADQVAAELRNMPGDTPLLARILDYDMIQAKTRELGSIPRSRELWLNLVQECLYTEELGRFNVNEENMRRIIMQSGAGADVPWVEKLDSMGSYARWMQGSVGARS